MFEKLKYITRSTVSMILLFMLIASFALWGISGTIFNLAAPYEVASVGKTEVTLNDYLVVYQQNLARVNERVGQSVNRETAQFYGVESGAREQVLTSATLDEYARRSNIGLSEERLFEIIAENPAYQRSDGSFDAAGLARTLQFSGVRESDFKRIENGNAIRNQIMGAIGHGDILPKAYSEALKEHKNEERQFEYITITPELAGNITEPTDEELRELFNEDEDKYDAPEYRKLVVLAMKPDDLADAQAIDEERIKQEYDEGNGDWVVLEKRQVEQIVLKQDELEETKKRIEEGATFDDLLSDNELEKSDADLGLLEETELHETLREVAFGLEKDVMSEIVDGQFGPTVLRVVDIQAGSTKPFEEVKQQIAEDMALRDAVDNILDYYNEIEDIRAAGTDLQEAAERVGLEIRIVEAVDSQGNGIDGERIADLPSSYELLRDAFATEVGDQTSPLDYEEIGYLWYEVVDITEARDRPFDEAREDVLADWQIANDIERVEAKVKEFEKRIEEGVELSVLAAELDKVDEARFNKEKEEEAKTNNEETAEESQEETAEQEEEVREKIEVKQTGYLKRDGNDQSFPRSALQEGFAHDTDKQVFVADAQPAPAKVVFKVIDSRMATAPETFEDDVENANQGAVNDMLRKFLEKLQDDYGTEFDYQLVDQALSGTLPVQY